MLQAFLRRAFVLLFACGAAATAACSGGGGIQPTTVVPTPAPTFSPVTINDSGSTNTDKFSIVVNANYARAISQTNRSNQQVTTRNGTATGASVTQLYADLNANLPVSSLATTTACNKSTSFGTYTTVTYDGSSSQDISCPTSTASQNVFNDVRNIENQFAPY